MLPDSLTITGPHRVPLRPPCVHGAPFPCDLCRANRSGSEDATGYRLSEVEFEVVYRQVIPDTGELADRLIALLSAGDWRPAVVLCREWYRLYCPRYSRDEVECKVGVWVGRMLMTQRGYEKRCLLQESEFGYLTPFAAQARFDDEIRHRWAEEPAIYRRYCRRLDECESAEAKVETVLRNMASWEG
jgi:hypothetical protein